MGKAELLEGLHYLISKGSLLKAMATILIASGLAFSMSPPAHDINLAKARDKAREFARDKRDDPGRTYKHFSTDCYEAFPGHNHYVRCTISYQNQRDTAKGRQTCTERIEVYLAKHGKNLIVNDQTSNEMFIKHTSAKVC